MKRGDGEEIPSKGIAKTAATALVIGSLACFVCLVYLLAGTKERPELPVMLSFAIPYGLVLLSMGVIGMVALTNAEKRSHRYLASISSISGGAVLVGLGIGLWAGLGSSSLGGSVIGIGVCVAGIGIAALLSVKEDKSK